MDCTLENDIFPRMVRGDIEGQLEREPLRKHEPYYFPADEELLPSYEDAVGIGEEGEEGEDEERSRIKHC